MDKVKEAMSHLSDALDSLNPNNSTPRPSAVPCERKQSTSTNALNSNDKILHDFRRQFPSLNAGGARYKEPPAKKCKFKPNPFIKDTWTHKFCALSSVDADQTPSTRELMDLTNAGLGIEKIVFPSKKGDHKMLLECLNEAFPKLCSQNGAFELLRAESGGVNRPLILIPPKKNGYPIDYLKTLVPGQSLLYIRPAQSDLIMDVDDGISSVQVACVTCNVQYPLNDIRAHQAHCANKDATDHFADMSSFEYAATNSSSGLGKSDHPSCSSGKKSVSKRNMSIDIGILTSMFPNRSQEEIKDIVAKSNSIDEAANLLSEKTEETAIIYPKETSLDEKASLKDVLAFFIERVGVTDEEIVLQIDRDSLWADALRFYKKRLHDNSFLKKTLIVDFKNEEGLDGGAVKTEFFNLLLQEIMNRLFEGDNEALLPVKDLSKAVLFKIAGMVITHSIVCGLDVGFPVLAKPYFLHVCGCDDDNLVPYLSKSLLPKNASTGHLLQLINALELCHSPENTDKLFYEDHPEVDIFWTLINSTHWPPAKKITYRDVPFLVQQLLMNEIIFTRRNTTDMFKDGLDCFGFLKILSQHVHVMESIFCGGNRTITSDDLLNCFNFDEPRCFGETQCKTWFITYVRKADCVKRVKLLAFTTGHFVIPLGGMKGQIKVKYQNDDDENSLCKSSACLKILYIPTVHSSEKAFEQMMNIALEFESSGFANP